MPALPSAYRHCPYCAGALTRAVGPEQRQRCRGCGAVVYHAAKPTTSAVILRRSDQAVLLVRRARAPYRGWWDLPGGFLNYAESPEEATIREVREETGLEVELRRLLGAWPHSYRRREGLDRNLSLCFLAEPVGGVAVAGDDAVALRWFPLDRPPRRLAWPALRRRILALVLQEAS